VKYIYDTLLVYIPTLDDHIGSMIQTGEARNNGNMIQTNIEPLVDMGSLDLLSDTLDCPLTISIIFWKSNNYVIYFP